MTLFYIKIMNSKTFFIETDELKDLFLANSDRNLLFIEEKFPDCKLFVLANGIRIKSENSETVSKVFMFFKDVSKLFRKEKDITLDMLEFLYKENILKPVEKISNKTFSFKTGTVISPKNDNQDKYITAMLNSDIVFGMGPAGTGKSYLAVAVAVYLLNIRKIDKIVLVRPVVEAGESLGFLPGDLKEKVDPYLMPLYDALHDFLGKKMVEDFIEDGTIEIAPLAFMRGRTLDKACIILDEAQNTTVPQMKMFLTRIGAGSKAFVTGDHTQIDLNIKIKSGLVDAKQRLQNIEGISFFEFEREDVVRHKLVIEILSKYEDELWR